jgi:hypothetical protein
MPFRVKFKIQTGAILDVITELPLHSWFILAIPMETLPSPPPRRADLVHDTICVPFASSAGLTVAALFVARMRRQKHKGRQLESCRPWRN